jgi:hypothetical protein
MNRKIRRRLESRKRKIKARLEPAMGGREPRVEGRPEFTTQRVQYEMAERIQAIPCGGIGAMWSDSKNRVIRDAIGAEAVHACSGWSNLGRRWAPVEA